MARHCVLLQDQAEAIHDLFGVLVAALHHDTDVRSILQQQLELAAEADILSCWPFAAVSAKEQSLAAMTRSLADLVYAAYNLQRLDNLLPALYQLMQLFTDVSPENPRLCSVSSSFWQKPMASQACPQPPTPSSAASLGYGTST